MNKSRSTSKKLKQQEDTCNTIYDKDKYSKYGSSTFFKKGLTLFKKTTWDLGKN